MYAAHMNGARLAFVVRKLNGNVKREKVEFVVTKKGQNGKNDTHDMKRVMKDEPAGFMVYFPRGHAIRVPTLDLLKHYGLDGKPRIINANDILADPNSPLGKIIGAQTEEERRNGMLDLERMVIQMATAKSGPVVMAEQVKEAA